MKYLLQVDFPYGGPFGDEMAEAMKGLALSIIQEPGCIWKLWTENESLQEAGGIYLFEDEATAKSYLQMHTKRLEAFGISDIRSRIFAVNEALSHITKGPVK